MAPQGSAARAAGLTPAPTAPRVGRDGALALRFERRGDRSVLAGCRWRLPLQVMATLAPGARLEWVPDHTIPFAGSAFRQRVEAEAPEGAALVLVDAFAAGRVARGEAWRFALLDSALSVHDARGWLLHDRLVLRNGAPGPGLGLAEGRSYVATVVVIADAGLAAFVDDCAALGGDGAEVGAGLLPRRGALVRCLAADAPALARTLDGIWAAARRRVLGLPPLALRKP